MPNEVSKRRNYVITPTCLDSDFRQVPSLSGSVHSEKGSGATIIKLCQDWKLSGLTQYSQYHLIVKVKATYHMIFDKCRNHRIRSRHAFVCTCPRPHQKRIYSCLPDQNNPMGNC